MAYFQSLKPSPSSKSHLNLKLVILIFATLFIGLTGCAPRPKYGIDIYFLPQTKFTEIEPNYQPGNLGFFWLSWNYAGWIQHANILIDSTVPQKLRNHLLREELTQSLGLMNDSPRFPHSIFFGGQSNDTAYLPIDRQLIVMLYQPDIQPNMTAFDVDVALNGQFSEQERLYFKEVALGAEYGQARAEIRKWRTDIPIRVHGSPTPDDSAELQKIIADINGSLDAIMLSLPAP